MFSSKVVVISTNTSIARKLSHMNLHQLAAANVEANRTNDKLIFSPEEKGGWVATPFSTFLSSYVRLILVTSCSCVWMC